MDAEELCAKAGINPNKKITKFVMVDLADVLVSAGWEEGKIIKALEKTRPNKLADTLCEASHWGEIFEIYAEVVLRED
jgi:hypothetical protein